MPVADYSDDSVTFRDVNATGNIGRQTDRVLTAVCINFITSGCKPFRSANFLRYRLRGIHRERQCGKQHHYG